MPTGPTSRGEEGNDGGINKKEVKLGERIEADTGVWKLFIYFFKFYFMFGVYD